MNRRACPAAKVASRSPENRAAHRSGGRPRPTGQKRRVDLSIRIVVIGVRLEETGLEMLGDPGGTRSGAYDRALFAE
jgi:hypothetical protein